MDRGARRATGRRVLKDSDTALSTQALHREDTDPYLESRRGRSRMDAQVRTGDYGWTTLSQEPGPGYQVLGRRVRTQVLEEPYCKPGCNFSFIVSDRNFIKVLLLLYL